MNVLFLIRNEEKTGMNDGITGQVPSSFPLHFFRSAGGKEPVRDWLKTLGRPDSLVIGEDIRLVQLAWPVGLPVCRPMGGGLHEVRSSLPGGRIARVLFCFHAGVIVLLHGFIKKTEKTPPADLRLAKERRENILRGE
jgi:phage-related protein